MPDKAHINREVLKWARVTAKINPENAAAKVPVPVEKIFEWENGASLPTIRQAEILAKVYRRPFAALFLPSIPRDFQLLQDFRAKHSRELTTSSVFIIREIQQKQAWLRDLYINTGEHKLQFVGKYSVRDNPETVAADITQTLKIGPPKYKKTNPILDWIEAAERNRIFVSRTSFVNTHLRLDSDELQGFVIADEYAPFIFINSDDWDAPQLFTLVHELVHIWIAETGISNETQPDIKNRERYHPVELFCSKVAALALMPTERILEIRTSTFNEYREISKVAKSFGISAYALLYRALSLNLINHKQYSEMKTQADYEFSEYLIRLEERKELQKANKGDLKIYYPLIMNRNGRLFTQTVLDAYRGGTILPTVASSLLNVHINKFQKLEAQLYK